MHVRARAGMCYFFTVDKAIDYDLLLTWPVYMYRIMTSNTWERETGGELSHLRLPAIENIHDLKTTGTE